MSCELKAYLVWLASENTPKKVSKAGFDVTPLTAQAKEEEAKKLTDFQR